MQHRWECRSVAGHVQMAGGQTDAGYYAWLSHMSGISHTDVRRCYKSPLGGNGTPPIVLDVSRFIFRPISTKRARNATTIDRVVLLQRS